jgi:hypothetical protein
MVLAVSVWLATRGQTDMRGLVTLRDGAFGRRADRVSKVERGGPSLVRRAWLGRGSLHALPPPAMVDEASFGCCYCSITARDQHQPASSRAIATLAMTGPFLLSMNLTQRTCSRRLPVSPQTRAVGRGDEITRGGTEGDRLYGGQGVDNVCGGAGREEIVLGGSGSM